MAVKTASPSEAFSIDFVGVGPMKTASSWLDVVLRQHPEACLPEGVKETLLLTKRFNRGWAWYEHYFVARRPGQRCGEIAPTLFRDPWARRRLQAAFPEARIVISLRDPVQRTYSHFLHARANGRVPDDFFEAVKVRPSILEAGRYHLHAPAWERDFTPNRVYYLFSEYVSKVPSAACRGLLDFLQLEPIQISAVDRRVGVGFDARSTSLSRYARAIARSLRSLHLDRAVNLAKQFGGRRALYRERQPDPMPDEVREFLEREHEDDYRFYNDRFADQKATPS